MVRAGQQPLPPSGQLRLITGHPSDSPVGPREPVSLVTHPSLSPALGSKGKLNPRSLGVEAIVPGVPVSKATGADTKTSGHEATWIQRLLTTSSPALTDTAQFHALWVWQQNKPQTTTDARPGGNPRLPLPSIRVPHIPSGALQTEHTLLSSP